MAIDFITASDVEQFLNDEFDKIIEECKDSAVLNSLYTLVTKDLIKRFSLRKYESDYDWHSPYVAIVAPNGFCRFFSNDELQEIILTPVENIMVRCALYINKDCAYISHDLFGDDETIVDMFQLYYGVHTDTANSLMVKLNQAALTYLRDKNYDKAEELLVLNSKIASATLTSDAVVEDLLSYEPELKHNDTFWKVIEW